MEYIKYMNNLRHALRVISALVPQVIEVAQAAAERERDQDLEIALMPDMAWDILQNKYLEVEDKLYQFNPEAEYGEIHTMWAEDMRGE